MIQHKVQQGTPEWLALRAGIPTASEWDALISPLGKIRTGEGVATYLAKKLAERWLGAPLASFGGGAMEQGSILEDEAIPFLEFKLETTIQRVGFITSDDGRIGCSPDGLFEDGSGAEIKSPQPAAHVGYLLDGALPSDYRAQVQGSMLVTGAARWLFCSYCRNFPPLILWVKRDEKYVASLAQALDDFNERLSVAYQHLLGLNGGRSPQMEEEEAAARERAADAAFMQELAVPGD